ncbi:MAG: folate family ECF transporter S component [Lactobacillus sp.]|nr:folate family ECF transporter S component [Lactobacillus sp.]MDN6052449.1 folate family ECF transporter S component [Lactobacillus sp.]
MKLKTKQVAGIAVLIALNIILGKFSIGPAFASVNLGFMALVIAGYLYGIKLTMLAAVLANLLAFTIMGSGAYSVVFLLPALLAGGAYGFLAKPTLLRIILVNLVVVIGISFFLNTGLIVYVNHLNYEALLASRVIKTLVSLPVQIGLSYFILRHNAIKGLRRKFAVR